MRAGISPHAFRRTMISVAEDCGARSEMVAKVTHPKSAGRALGAYGVYSLPEWRTLCDEISRIDYGVSLPWW